MVKRIGIFDSGVGGLTVFREVQKALPSHQIFYFGDTARVPYGTKDQETVIRFSLESAFFLLEQKIDLLVVACNTATAFALDTLRQELSIPVIGVITPGVKVAARKTKNKKVGVIGTTATMTSNHYEKQLLELQSELKVYSTACPLFVPFVEEGLVDHLATRLMVAEYLDPLLDKGIDTLLLGCTHYPLLKTLLQEYCGNEVTLIDSAEAIAKEVCSFCDLSPRELSKAQFFVTSDPGKFHRLANQLLGLQLEEYDISKIGLDRALARM